MREADPGILDLVGVLPAQLHHGFVDLRHARRAHGVALREQAAGRIDGDGAADSRTPFQRPASALASRHHAQVLGIDDLGDREAVVKLDEIEILWRDAGCRIGPLRRRHGRFERAQIRMPGEMRGAPGLHRGQHVDGEIRRASGPVPGRDHDGRGPIARGAAVVELHGIGNHRRLPDDVEREVGAELGQRVLQAVALVLDADGRDFFARYAPARRIGLPGFPEKARERQPAFAVFTVVAGAKQRLRDVLAVGLRHLLDAHGDGRIAQARLHRHHGMAEGNATRRAGALDLGAGHVRQPDLVANDAGQHFLSRQRPGDEVAEIERADVLAVETRPLERGLGRCRRKALDVLVGMPPERRRSDPGDGNVTHGRPPSRAARAAPS